MPALERNASWTAGRARNALRRTMLVAVVGGATFLVALLTLVLVPRQATRAARVTMPLPSERPDTLPLAARVARAQSAVARAESLLVKARGAAAARPAVPLDTLPPALVARRDTLARAVASLNRLLARAQNAPLPASYRALGQARELRGDPRVRALLDSLASIERERDSFDNLGGVDPIFVALTARATAVGRTIQGIAEARRGELRRELAALQPAPPPPPLSPAAAAAADTAAALARVARARRELGQAAAALRVARAKNHDVDRRLRRARELANVTAPPVALLAAALVLGLAAGFGASFVAELRHPRLSDPGEAERITGARVLTVIRSHAPVAERARRRADAEIPPAIEQSSESYRMLYLRFAPLGGAIPLITVTGDEPEIVATVAANLAAASVMDARSTLLVDADLQSGAVSRVVRIGAEPGLAGVLEGRVECSEAIATTPLGRDGLLDVIPNGTWVRGEPVEAAVEEVRRDLARLARRYDMTVLVEPATHAERGAKSFLPSPDVVVCAQLGMTPLERLAEMVERLRGAGMRVLGLVLWAADPPQLPTREELASGRRSSAPRRREAAGSGVT